MSISQTDLGQDEYRVYRFVTKRGTTSQWDVHSRYTLQHSLGEGGYGIVCSAVDNQLSKNVAIKQVHNAFNKTLDAKRLQREIKLLKHFKHENILPLLDIMKPASFERFDDVYMVTELMDTDLHRVVRRGIRYTEQHCKHFLYLLLRGLKCIHSANVLHRDLKPGNILINQTDCSLKICDFGLARGIDADENLNNDLTLYVTTRWYRAPEVILNSRSYSKAVDMWSVGCIFAELLGKLDSNTRPLFPGQDYMDQLKKIIDIMGSPNPQDIQDIGQENARKYLYSLGYRPKVPLETIYRSASRQAIHLLEWMLKFNPAERPTVEQALEHPYLSELHDETDEPLCHAQFDFSFENAPDNKIKEMVFEEMLTFHPDLAAQYKHIFNNNNSGDDMNY